MGQVQSRTPVQPELIGPACECELDIDSNHTKGLIDTGSTVSTISYAFYTKYLSHLELKPVKQILDIECADGSPLPYLGFIEAELRVKYLSSLMVPFLVVHDTKYNNFIPVLIGTNCLQPLMSDCKCKHGVRFLQVANLTLPWYTAFQCLSARDRQLKKNGYSLGLVRNCEQTVLPSNQQITLSCYVDRALPYQSTLAMTQPSRLSSVSSDVDVPPMLISYDYKDNGRFDMVLSNITTRTVSIPSKTIICELHPVTLDSTVRQKTNVQSSIDQVEINQELPVDLREPCLAMLNQFQDVFSKGDDDIGHCTAVKHRIDLENEVPFKQRSRYIAPSMFDEVRNHFHQLLSAGIIRRSKSPWSSNAVLVRKKDGKLRVCVDFRQLNQRTVKDAYALPRIDDILQSLGGNSYFTVLDMKSGYHQIELEETHKERTAFTVGPLGFYEWNRLPMGLCNSPATYQRLMEDILGDLHLRICVIYLDDIIIFSKSYDQHLERLARVLQRLRENGLKLSPKKCKFLMGKVTYVGHVVSSAGVEADSSKTDKIQTWPKPRNAAEVRSFLGFAGYYRKFVKGFAQIARPLYDLMPCLTKKSKKPKKSETPAWIWGERQDQAFQQLKDALTLPPVLGYPDYQLPFELHTDASGKGLGAVLYQEQDGVKRVLSFGSRGLKKGEQHYSAFRLEFLALKWAVTEKFHDYLYGHRFTVYSDNNPLTYVMTTAKLDATGHRWLAALAQFDFDIVYRPGKTNADADALSRLPLRIGDMQKIDTETIQALCKQCSFTPAVDVVCLAETTDIFDSDDEAGQDFNTMTQRDWKKAQYNDQFLKRWVNFVHSGQKPRRDRLPASKEDFAMLRIFDSLELKQGVLYRNSQMDDQTKRLQLVLPKQFVSQALRHLHNDCGHPGRDRTLSLMKDRFYFPGMTSVIENWVQNCSRCIKRKTPMNTRSPLVTITTTQPMELVCMDYLTLESSKGGFQNVLVITDHFTRYAQAIVTRNQTARTTAEALFNNFIVHYGFPRRLHSDQGANFESRIIKELCQIAGVEKSRTTSYHPMGNGMCERFNRSLLNMLGTLQPDQKRDWKSHVSPLVHAYNCTRHESTGQTPFFLMFGREPRLPIDLAFGLEINRPKQTLTQYVTSMKNRLKQAYEVATKEANKARQRQKGHYDLKIRGATLEPGDRVLVKIVAFDGKHKIEDRWEDDVYIVEKKPNPDVPVFVVSKENGTGRQRVLHRNLLLPIGSMLMDELDKDKDTYRPKPAPRKSLRRKTNINRVPTTSSASESDDDTQDEDVDVEIVVREQPTQGVEVTGTPDISDDDFFSMVDETEYAGNTSVHDDDHDDTVVEELDHASDVNEHQIPVGGEDAAEPDDIAESEVSQETTDDDGEGTQN